MVGLGACTPAQQDNDEAWTSAVESVVELACRVREDMVASSNARITLINFDFAGPE